MKFLSFNQRLLSSAVAMARNFSAKYVFLDLELTGLDIEKDVIMEVACVLTTDQLKPLHSGYHAIPHVEDSKLTAMDEWCTKHHGESGLTDACRNSKISLAQVEQQLAEYVKQHSESKDVLYLAGNTVYMDRLFLAKHMKTFDKLLHYRIVDVSSIKTLCYAWYPQVKHPRKKLAHRALDDIYESIQELQYYRENCFK